MPTPYNAANRCSGVEIQEEPSALNNFVHITASRTAVNVAGIATPSVTKTIPSSPGQTETLQLRPECTPIPSNSSTEFTVILDNDNSDNSYRMILINLLIFINAYCINGSRSRRDVLLVCVFVSYFCVASRPPASVKSKREVVMHSGDVSKLKQYVEKIENLETEKTEILEHISDVYRQAKSDGFDPGIMRKVLKLKRMRTEDRETQDMLLDTYMLALGLIPSDEGTRESNV
jgi:uncharacterized protein (UPF0335 family)